MFRNIFRSNSIRDFSKLKIVKNLVVTSLSFLFIKTGDEGLLMLQTTMNKEEGVGTISLAITSLSYGLTSLFFSSFIVKKLGSKNSLLLGIITCLPFIAYNFFPAWITMLPSAILRGFGISLLWASQCTYLIESSIMFCKLENDDRKSKYTYNIEPQCENADVDEKITTVKPKNCKMEQISVVALLSKTGEISVSSENSAVYHADPSSVRLTAYRYCANGASEDKLYQNEKNTEKAIKTKKDNLKIYKYSEASKIQKNDYEERKQEIPEKIKDLENTTKYQSYVDSTKAMFFGIHCMASLSATVWSSLISYYVLKTGEKDYNVTTNFFCGAHFCSANEGNLKGSILEVQDSIRYLLIGVCSACGIVAPLLVVVVLDKINKKSKKVKFSWNHVFATVKYINRKDQLFLIPFTVGASLCRGFYMADFTKAYIACAWSISHIGLITVIYGAISALSSIISGVAIKYVGRRSVMVLCHIITIANFVFLFLWSPDAHQSYIFYIQGGIYGMIVGIFNSQTKAFYGIIFEGDEETAFSSYNLYTSIGWALPFIYENFLCVSVKIYIGIAFSCTGLLGYLLAERSYNLRDKKTDSTK